MIFNDNFYIKKKCENCFTKILLLLYNIHLVIDLKNIF